MHNKLWLEDMTTKQLVVLYCKEQNVRKLIGLGIYINFDSATVLRQSFLLWTVITNMLFYHSL